MVAVTVVLVLLAGAAQDVNSDAVVSSGGPPPVTDQVTNRAWVQLVSQASALGLPARFLRAISPDFVTLQFEDLHAFAAEYHPEEHRMILNRALSFNAAAGSLRPLTTLTHRELGTLYHELFHAYVDYLRTQPDQANGDPIAVGVLGFAELQRLCRYQTVNIAPVVQRPGATEPRYLNDRESWEALNETWAVFVGWAIWSRLEVTGGRGSLRKPSQFRAWIRRLQQADRDGDLIGYYEPDEPSERTIARKRYLARTDRISSSEVRFLLEMVLEMPSEDAVKAVKMLPSDSGRCQGAPSGESPGVRP